MFTSHLPASSQGLQISLHLVCTGLAARPTATLSNVTDSVLPAHVYQSHKGHPTHLLRE